jgi:hypothetical protein
MEPASDDELTIMGEVEELQWKLRDAGRPVDQTFATLVMNSIASESQPSERRKKWRIRRACLQRLVDNLPANSGGAAAVTVARPILAPAVARNLPQQPTPDLRPAVKIEEQRPHKRRCISKCTSDVKYHYKIYDDGSAPAMARIHVAFVENALELIQSERVTLHSLITDWNERHAPNWQGEGQKGNGRATHFFANGYFTMEQLHRIHRGELPPPVPLPEPGPRAGDAGRRRSPDPPPAPATGGGGRCPLRARTAWAVDRVKPVGRGAHHPPLQPRRIAGGVRGRLRRARPVSTPGRRGTAAGGGRGAGGPAGIEARSPRDSGGRRAGRGRPPVAEGACFKTALTVSPTLHGRQSWHCGSLPTGLRPREIWPLKEMVAEAQALAREERLEACRRAEEGPTAEMQRVTDLWKALAPASNDSADAAGGSNCSGEEWSPPRAPARSRAERAGQRAPEAAAAAPTGAGAAAAAAAGPGGGGLSAGAESAGRFRGSPAGSPQTDGAGEGAVGPRRRRVWLAARDSSGEEDEGKRFGAGGGGSAVPPWCAPHRKPPAPAGEPGEAGGGERLGTDGAGAVDPGTDGPRRRRRPRLTRELAAAASESESPAAYADAVAAHTAAAAAAVAATAAAAPVPAAEEPHGASAANVPAHVAPEIGGVPAGLPLALRLPVWPPWDSKDAKATLLLDKRLLLVRGRCGRRLSLFHLSHVYCQRSGLPIQPDVARRLPWSCFRTLG